MTAVICALVVTAVTIGVIMMIFVRSVAVVIVVGAVVIRLDFVVAALVAVTIAVVTVIVAVVSVVVVFAALVMVVVSVSNTCTVCQCEINQGFE